MCASAYSESNPFEAYQWRHRLIIVFAQDPLTDVMVDSFKSADTEITERNILWFIVDEDRCVTNQVMALPDEFAATLRQRYLAPDQGLPQVILIGKDGGIKLRERKLNLTKLFTLIDSMPMRQSEMRQN